MPITFSGIPQIQYHLAQAADKYARAAHHKGHPEPHLKGVPGLLGEAKAHLKAIVMDDDFERFVAKPDLTAPLPSFQLKAAPDGTLHNYFRSELPRSVDNFQAGMQDLAEGLIKTIEERYSGTGAERVHRVTSQARALLRALGYQN